MKGKIGLYGYPSDKDFMEIPDFMYIWMQFWVLGFTFSYLLLLIFVCHFNDTQKRLFKLFCEIKI